MRRKGRGESEKGSREGGRRGIEGERERERQKGGWLVRIDIKREKIKKNKRVKNQKGGTESGRRSE